jgi:hypothetical protein
MVLTVFKDLTGKVDDWKQQDVVVKVPGGSNVQTEQEEVGDCVEATKKRQDI